MSRAGGSRYTAAPFRRQACLTCYSVGGGHFVAIEVKQPGEKPTMLQRHIMKKITAAGGLAFAAESAGDEERTLATTVF